VCLFFCDEQHRKMSILVTEIRIRLLVSQIHKLYSHLDQLIEVYIQCLLLLYVPKCSRINVTHKLKE
jgi:hypothetical protein